MRYVGHRLTDTLSLMRANAVMLVFPLDRQYWSRPARAKYVLLAGRSRARLEGNLQSPLCSLAFNVLILASQYSFFLYVLFLWIRILAT